MKTVLAVGALAVVAMGFVACVGFGAGEGTPAIVACDACVDATPATDGPSSEDSDASDAAAAIPETCDAAAHDLKGCLCTTPGAASPCYQGVPGPKSACNTAGAQQCLPTPDGNGKHRWSACVGGAKPNAIDTCHDDVDDDCDGKIDQGCACTGDVDLCRPQGADAGAPTFDPNAYTMFTIPSKPKPNQPFDLYIVTKNRTLQSPGLLKNGAICYGGGLSKACPSAGDGCSGWKVGFFKGVNEAGGTYDFSIKDPQGPTGCEGATIATLNVVVAN